MKVVKLSEFIIQNCSRMVDSGYDTLGCPFVPRKQYSPDDLISDIINDTDHLDVYGSLYILRDYAFLLDGKIVHNIISKVYNFIHKCPHVNATNLLRGRIGVANSTNIKIVNPYRMDNSLFNVPMDKSLEYISQILESKCFELYFNDTRTLCNEIMDISKKIFHGHVVQIDFIQSLLESSLLHERLHNGENISNPSYEKIKDIDGFGDTPVQTINLPNSIEKEELLYSLVTGVVSDDIKILSSNILIAFQLDNIESKRSTIMKNMVFVVMVSMELHINL